MPDYYFANVGMYVATAPSSQDSLDELVHSIDIFRKLCEAGYYQVVLQNLLEKRHRVTDSPAEHVPVHNRTVDALITS